MDIIDKLRAATEGSRALDLEVMNALGGKHQWFWLDRDNETITCERYGAGAVGNPICSLERFTASVDDAASLVPDGYVWGCGYSQYVPHQAWVSSDAYYKGQWIGECDGSRAIALCIAAIEARRAR